MAARQTKTPAATGVHNKTLYKLHSFKTLTFGQDIISAFTEAMRNTGISLAAGVQIVPDGKLHRARAADDKPGQLSIWYNFHPDAPASGTAGNWRTGARLKWCGKRLSTLSASERAEMARRITEDSKRAQESTEARHRYAAERAARIWIPSPLAAAMHPYLQHKGIAPGIARQFGPALVLPVQDFTGKLWGLQFIHPDGSKRFLLGMKKSGCFIPVDTIPDGTRSLWIAEGWATSSTLATMKPDACHVAACDAGNLASVAQAARAKWPGLVIVICPDFDTIGREKAKQAAISARCLILPPPAVIPPYCSDWNDWTAAKRQGVTS